MNMFNRVRDKLGISAIPLDSKFLSDREIKEAVEKWTELFSAHKILLSFNEQEIDYPRRYAFIRDVFLDVELPSHPPELYFCFLYDQYKQDSIPDAPEAMVGGLLEEILGGVESAITIPMHKRIKFNHFHNLSEPEFRYVIDCHQKKNTSLAGITINHEDKKLIGNRLVLMGSHTTGYSKTDYCTIHRGNWRVELCRSEGKWVVAGIFIEGIEF